MIFDYLVWILAAAWFASLVPRGARAIDRALQWNHVRRARKALRVVR
jgi:hypothetical protein